MQDWHELLQVVVHMASDAIMHALLQSWWIVGGCITQGCQADCNTLGFPIVCNFAAGNCAGYVITPLTSVLPCNTGYA